MSTAKGRARVIGVSRRYTGGIPLDPAQYEGALVYNADQQRIEYSDGNAWHPIEGGEGPEGPPGPVSVEIGDVETVPFEVGAAVRNVGDSEVAILEFDIPHGPEGPEGPRGPKGQMGQPLVLEGAVDEVDELPDPEDAEYGEAWLVDGELYQFDGDDWRRIGSLTGERGPEGEKGEKGEPGEGAEIVEVSAHTVSSGAGASVINRGDERQARFEFYIPEGPQGEQGPPGMDGEPSEAVAVKIEGVVDTESELPGAGDRHGETWMVDSHAYIWDADGQEWVNAGGIQGPEGPEGPKGERGDDAVINSVTVTTVAAPEDGGEAAAYIEGDPSAIDLELLIPQGNKGGSGEISVVDTETIDPRSGGAVHSNEAFAKVINESDDSAHAKLRFQIPRGYDFKVVNAIASHLDPDQSPTVSVEEVGPSEFDFSFGIPQGEQGERGPTGFTTVVDGEEYEGAKIHISSDPPSGGSPGDIWIQYED